MASSSSRDDIQVVLGHLGLDNYFDAVVSGYEVAAGKPAPDIFLEAARRIQVNPGQSIVLEDAAVGVKAAKAAGMKAIAVESRHTAGQDFSEADLVVSSLEELNWDIIKNLGSLHTP